MEVLFNVILNVDCFSLIPAQENILKYPSDCLDLAAQGESHKYHSNLLKLGLERNGT